MESVFNVQIITFSIQTEFAAKSNPNARISIDKLVSVKPAIKDTELSMEYVFKLI